MLVYTMQKNRIYIVIEITFIRIDLIVWPPEKCDYINKDERLTTFASWPLMFVSPDDLGAAGFSMFPFMFVSVLRVVNDKVQCFDFRIHLSVENYVLIT